MYKRRWTDDDRDEFRFMAGSGKPIRVIAVRLDRRNTDIFLEAARFGIESPPVRPGK